MKNLKISFILLTTVFTFAGVKTLQAQYDNSIFGLKTVIQNNLNNPSYIPEYSMHVGVPGLSSVYGGFGSSGFKYTDLFKRTSDDSLILNNKGLLSALGNKNNIHVNSTVQWLNAGYKWKDFYFNFAVSEVFDLSANYSKDLLEFGLYGNGNYIGETADFSDTYMKFLHYREYAFGAAWKMDDKWSFGAKMKLLFGKSSFHTKSLDAKLTTSENTFNLTSETNMQINTSMPKAWFDDSKSVSNSEYLFYGGNFGLGFDLGASYKYDDQFSFSASVLDLGYIKFDRYLKNFSNQNVAWTFEGFDLWDFDGLDSAQFDSKLNTIGDSLIEKFQLKETSEKYNVMLTAKIYLSGNYKLSDKENIGLVFRSEFMNKIYHPAVTVSYSRKIDKHFSAMASYTAASRSFFNIGLGVVCNIEPVQIYFVTDNFVGIFTPDIFKTANFHLGVNIFMPQKSAGRSLIE